MSYCYIIRIGIVCYKVSKLTFNVKVLNKPNKISSLILVTVISIYPVKP